MNNNMRKRHPAPHTAGMRPRKISAVDSTVKPASRHAQSAYLAIRPIDTPSLEPEETLKTPSHILQSRPPGMPRDLFNKTGSFMAFPETPIKSSKRKRSRSRSHISENKGVKQMLSPRFQLAPLEIASREEGNGSGRESLALRSFFQNFVDDDVNYKDEIDLEAHARESGRAVRDETVQEIAAQIPHLRSLNLSWCSDVTDSGLCAVAKYCSELRSLNICGCSEITGIGLRAIAQGCRFMESIDLSECENIDDNALTSIAAGGWSLKTFILRRSNKVTDHGLEKVVRCCKSLTHLDVSECPKIGERGAASLHAIGKHCKELLILDLFGCRCVQDAAIMTIAQGCSKLSTLKLTGCNEVHSASIKVLAQNCRNLEVLSLAGCQDTTNAALEMIGECCQNLTWLDVSGSPKISKDGIASLVKNCRFLEHLNLANCKRITDETLFILSKRAKRLQNLSLLGCKRVTGKGIAAVARSCPKLFTMNVLHCQVEKRFMQELAKQVAFVQVTSFGFKPLENAEELWREQEHFKLETRCATKIQAFFRGVQSRGGVWALKLKQVERTILPKIQARVRGHLARKKFRHEQRQILERKMAIEIQRLHRGYRARKRVRRMRRVLKIQENEEEAAIIFQKIFRGYQDRKLVAEMREELHLERQLEMRRVALLEAAAIKVQQAYRGHRGRADAGAMRTILEAKKQYEKKCEDSAVFLQRVYRGRLGRKMRLALKLQKEEERQREESAAKMQSLLRGRQGRKQAALKRLEKQKNSIDQAALVIQRYWRGSRDSQVSSMLFSLTRLRVKESQAAKCIQRNFRGYQTRGFVKAFKEQMALRVKQQQGALCYQRLYRGYKGRERAEVYRALRGIQTQLKAEYAELHKLESELADATKTLDTANDTFDREKKDQAALQTELTKVKEIKTPFHDSARITGTSQRYRTPYLQQMLTQQLSQANAKLAIDERNIEHLTKEKKEIERELRGVKRRLQPLTEGVEHRTIVERNKRLRKQVREQKNAAKRIQKVFRGYRVRCAYAEGYNYWIELYNEELGRRYFYNTFTYETRWTRPIAMDIFGDSCNTFEDTGHSALATWRECFDSETGLYYYFNNKTGDCRWEKPAELGGDVTDQDLELGKEWFEEQDMALISARSVKKRDLGDWEEHQDTDTKNTYYYNPITGESKWVLSPRSIHSARSTGRRSAASVGREKKSARWQYEYGYEYDEKGLLTKSTEMQSPWMEVMDESSGYPYYYNHVTDEYRWEKPEEFDDPKTGRSATDSKRSWFADQDKGALTSRSEKKRIIGDWVEMLDPETGFTYYFNAETQESRWSLSPRSARVEEVAEAAHLKALKTDSLPSSLRTLLERLSIEEVDYEGRENHLKWMNDAIESVEWMKAEGIAQMIIDRQNEPLPPDGPEESPDAAVEIPEATVQPIDEPHEPVEEVVEEAEAEPQEVVLDEKEPMSAESPEAWLELDDGNGNLYYYNQVTGESRWDLPALKATGTEALLERYGDDDDQSIETAVRRAFADFDVDGTGYIDKGEMGALIASLGVEMEENQLDEVVYALDSSGDGQISIDEFLAWWTSGTDDQAAQSFGAYGYDDASHGEYYGYTENQEGGTGEYSGYDTTSYDQSEYEAERAYEGTNNDETQVWQQYDDGEGNWYYYNTVTGETSWEPPPTE